MVREGALEPWEGGTEHVAGLLEGPDGGDGGHGGRDGEVGAGPPRLTAQAGLVGFGGLRTPLMGKTL